MELSIEKNMFIDIIKVAITDRRININKEKIENIIKMSKFHSVETIIYEGLKKENIEVPEYFEKIVNTLKIKSTVQDAEKESIGLTLEEMKINHIFLKGTVIRPLYNKTYFRSMADIDILVDKTKLKKVKKIMKNLGYDCKAVGGNHDVYYKLPFMNVEVHRDLLHERIDYSKYFVNAFSFARKVKDYEYELSNEDYYIFMIAHAAKHFSSGGMGVRFLIDEFVFLSHYESTLDKVYINKKLEKINLKSFENKIRNISLNLFQNKELRDDDILILDYILECGTYGKITNAAIIKGLFTSVKVESNKKKYIIRRIFPSYKEMKERNPILKKIPLLLPFFWFSRLIKGLFKYNNYQNEVKSIKTIDKDEVNRVNYINQIISCKGEQNEN